MAKAANSGGLASAFNGAVGKFGKYFGWGGWLVILVLAPTIAAAAATPTLSGVGASYFNFVASNFTQNFVAGWETIGTAVADGAGTVADLTV